MNIETLKLSIHLNGMKVVFEGHCDGSWGAFATNQIIYDPCYFSWKHGKVTKNLSLFLYPSDKYVSI